MELNEFGTPLVSSVNVTGVTDAIQMVRIDDILRVTVESGKYVVHRDGVIVGKLRISPTDYKNRSGTLRVQTLKIGRSNVITTYGGVFYPEGRT